MDVAMLVVTAFAALVVGWQSWETRRSAEASRRALSIANEALDLARVEERNTRELMVEGLKTRIDAEMPNLVVLVTETAPFVQEPDTSTLRLPRDAAREIEVVFEMTIVNQTDLAIPLVRSGPPIITPGRWEVEQDNFVLEPRQHKLVRLTVSRNIHQWATLAEDAATTGTTFGPEFEMKHHFLNHTLITFNYASPGDAGAWDSYEVRLVGSPLVKVEDEAGSWRLTPTVVGGPSGSLALVVGARNRVYWRSRSREEQL